MDDSDKIMKGLTALAIEKTLLDIGKPVYQKVADTLYKKYQCYIPDCFENPEYLQTVLKELYGKSYDEIIKSIQRELKEFSDKESIKKFLQVLSR